MNTAMIILMIITVSVTIFVVGFLLYSLHSKAHLIYRQKLADFENKKKRIEEELENDKKRFKRNS
ncbi:MAG: hypothetical protein K2K06_12040 [Oscillospiraceae bacterium]|nr:hypothetical protein [Oscillospiraceae bacterium]